MKHIKSGLLLLALLSLVFSSCKKSSSNVLTSANSMSLKFNGTLFNTSSTVASYNKSQNALQIFGPFSSTSAVYLAIIGNVKAGTFDLSGSSGAGATYSNGTNLQNTYIAESGKIVITEFTSTTVSGTFQFTGTSTSNVTGVITEGKFTAKVTQQ